MDHNHSLRKKWADDVGKMIVLYKNKPALYNGLLLNIESQHDFVELTDQLNKISANTYSLDEVYSKIKALRKKLVDVEKTKKKNGVQPTWKHYDDLRFLIPYLQELNGPLVRQGKPNAKEETSKKDRDAYVDSFMKCVQMDLKKIRSSDKQDHIMRKIRSVVDSELKKQ